jgi:hypothetical protein
VITDFAVLMTAQYKIRLTKPFKAESH